MPMPPVWFRRVLIAPAVLVVCLVLLATMPVWLLIAAICSPCGSGRLRPLRVLWVVAVYLALEVLYLLVLFALWVGAGFGWRIRTPRCQRAHYVLVGRFLAALFR